MDTFGEVLKRIREGMGVTQVSFASTLHIARPTLAGYESGSRPSRDTLDRICEYLPEHEEELRRAWDGAEPDLEGPSESGPDTQDELDAMFLRRSRSSVDIEGEWHALWQTVVHGKENRNHEVVSVHRLRKSWHMQNLERSAENPDGGYLWHAQCLLYDNQFLLGSYISREPNVRSKGTLYLVLHPSGASMLGHWVGCNYDTVWAQGLFALARSKDRVDEFLDAHILAMPPMPYTQTADRQRRTFI